MSLIEEYLNGFPIVMYDYITNEPIEEFDNARIATRRLFKGVSSKIYNNLHKGSKKTKLKCGRKVYFRYKE